MRRLLIIALIFLSGCQVVILRTGKSAEQGAWSEKTIIVVSPPPIIETHHSDKALYPTGL